MAIASRRKEPRTVLLVSQRQHSRVHSSSQQHGHHILNTPCLFMKHSAGYKSRTAYKPHASTTNGCSWGLMPSVHHMPWHLYTICTDQIVSHGMCTRYATTRATTHNSSISPDRDMPLSWLIFFHWASALSDACTFALIALLITCH